MAGKVLAYTAALVVTGCRSDESVVTTTVGDSGHESTVVDTTLSSGGDSGDSSGAASTSTGSDTTGAAPSSSSEGTGTTGTYEGSNGTHDSSTGIYDSSTGTHDSSTGTHDSSTGAHDSSTGDDDSTTGEPGPCNGELLADKLGGPWALSRQGAHLYFTTRNGATIQDEDDGGVWRVPIDGGVPELLAGPLDGVGLATTPTALFWSQESGGLLRANLDGTAPQSLMHNAPALAVDEAHLFTASSIYIDRFPIAGGPRQTIVSAADDGEDWYGSYEIAVDDQRVYWTTGETVESAGKDGSGRLTVATGQQYAGGVVSDGEHVFWLDINNPAGCELRRAPVAGGAIEPLWTDPTPFMTPRDCSPGTSRIVLDDDYVYWGGDRVQRAPKAGGAPQIVAECNVRYLRDLVVDDTHVYWLNFDGTCEQGGSCLTGSLWRTLKPN